MPTPNYGFPFPSLGDVPNIPADVEALAEAVDTELLRAISGTGPRNIDNLAVNGWGLLGSRLVRIGDMVSLTARLDASGATSGLVLTLPDGFRPDQIAACPLMSNATGPRSNTVYVASNGTLNVGGTLPNQVESYIALTYSCIEDWPTVLPGTPA